MRFGTQHLLLLQWHTKAPEVFSSEFALPIKHWFLINICESSYLAQQDNSIDQPSKGKDDDVMLRLQMIFALYQFSSSWFIHFAVWIIQKSKPKQYKGIL